MRTEIIMTPQELEDIKREVFNKVCKCICTGNILLDISKANYGDCQIDVTVGPLDKDFNYKTAIIYTNTSSLITPLQKLMSNDDVENSQYKIGSFEKN